MMKAEKCFGTQKEIIMSWGTIVKQHPTVDKPQLGKKYMVYIDK
jgi:hypothetical protein